jgi:hypothetical protein
MEVRFESGNLDDDEVLDRCELMLDFDDVLRLEEARRRAREQGGEIVVRLADVGQGEDRQRMLAFGYDAPGRDRPIWKGTLAALARAAGIDFLGSRDEP